MEIGRRGFLKISAGAALGLGLSPFGLKAIQSFGQELEVPPGPGIETWVTSICQQCPGGCGINVKLVDGIPIKIEGNPVYPVNRGKLCPLGQAGLQVLYDPDRIKGPLTRTGQRGAGQWTSISWDEALETVAARLKELREKGEAHTAALVAGRCRGLIKSLFARFLQAYGSPNYLTSYTADVTEKALYLTQGIEDMVCYDLENANYIISFGCNLVETWWSPVRQLLAYGYLRQGRPGVRTKIVQIDSRFSVTAAKADEWIPINPGTDAALALGLAHIMIKEGLYDQDFVAGHTFGFDDWADSEGIRHTGFKTLVLADYSPGEVSRVTGVPVETVIRLAREFASNRPALAAADRGVGLHSNGLYSRMAVHSLNALVGNFGKKGGILVQNYPQYAALPPEERDAIARKGLAMPRLDGAGTRKFPLAKSVLTALPEAILSERPYKVNALFLYYSNPLFSSINPSGFQQALERVPFIVSFSPFMDESSAQADLILPDHTYLERWQDDPTLATFGYPFFGIRQPVIEPLHQTRNTADVIIELAKKLGGAAAKSFPWKDYKELFLTAIEGIFKQAKGSVVGTAFEASWYKFLEKRGWWAPTYNNLEEFWQQLVEKGGWWDPSYQFEQWSRLFKTPSGKFEFFSQLLKRKLEGLTREGSQEKGASREAGMGQLLKELKVGAEDDAAFMPHHEPCRKMGDEKDYPFILNSFKLMTHAGGRGANQPHLQEILGLMAQRQWDSWVEINPHTAKELGIANGDWVWVESPAGKIKTRAKLFPGAMPQVVNIPYELGHTAYGRWARDRGVNPNRMIQGDYDYLAGSAVWFDTRVKIYKA